MYRTVLMGLTSSMMDILCFMCRAMRERTDRTWVWWVFISPGSFVTLKGRRYITALKPIYLAFQERLAAVCAGLAPCHSCSATSTMSATLPPATTTPIGCPHRSLCPCPWPPSQERASSPSSAGSLKRAGGGGGSDSGVKQEARGLISVFCV